MTTAVVTVSVIVFLALFIKVSTMDDNTAATQARQSRLTEKRRDYAGELKKTDVRRLLQKLQKNGSELSETDICHVTKERAEVLLVKIRHWKDEHITCLQAQEDLKSLLSDADLEEQLRANKEVLIEMNVLRGELETLEGKMLTFVQERAETNATSEDNIEDGRSAVTVRSTTSSVRARLLEKKIDDERQKAKAAVEIAALRRRRELERRQHELQWEMEELELQTQLEMSDVQSAVAARHEAVLATLEENASGLNAPARANGLQLSKCSEDGQIRTDDERRRARSTTGDAMRPTESAHQTQSSEQPRPADHQITSVDSSMVGILTNLSQLMVEQSRRSQLPALEPEIFTGELDKFSEWLSSFESYIEVRTQLPIERLHYLSVYTGGEAHRAIQGLLQLRSDNAYEQAKLKLKDRYGNEFTTANMYRSLQE